MNQGDDWVDALNSQGKPIPVSLVSLGDSRPRGRLVIPLMDDDERDRVSGRSHIRRRLETRDWMLAFVGLIVMVSSVAGTIVDILSRGAGK